MKVVLENPCFRQAGSFEPGDVCVYGGDTVKEESLLLCVSHPGALEVGCAWFVHIQTGKLERMDSTHSLLRVGTAKVTVTLA